MISNNTGKEITLTAKIIHIVDGKSYEEVPEEVDSGCAGCVASDNSKLCTKLPSCAGGRNGNNVIYKEYNFEEVKEEQKYTKEEIEAALNRYFGYSVVDMKVFFQSLERVIEINKLKQDPEYSKFVELQKKFGKLF